MPLQDIVTIVVAVIGVLGTLAGGITGNTLSNRHAKQQDQLKLQQEKIKRDNAVIEEVYQTLIKTNGLLDALDYDVSNKKMSDNDCVTAIKEVRAVSDRTKTLVNLYLPSIKQNYEKHSSAIGVYWNAIGAYNAKKNVRSPQTEEFHSKSVDAMLAYKESLKELQAKLEELVK